VRLPAAALHRRPRPGQPSTIVSEHTWPAGNGTGRESSPTTSGAGEREIRQSIARVITGHLQASAVTSWSDKNIDFTGALLENADFDDATFSGKNTSFDNATFSGQTNAVDASCGTDFEGTTVTHWDRCHHGLLRRTKKSRKPQPRRSGGVQAITRARRPK